MTNHRMCNKSNTTGATCGARITYPSKAPEFAPVFFSCLSGVRVVLVGNLHINTFLVPLRFPRKHDVQVVLSPISFVGVHVL